VTELEWDRCTDARPMLKVLAGRAGARKLRLFAVAWCRSLSAWLSEEGGRHAVEVAERFADGLARADELAACAAAAGPVARSAVVEGAAADRAACSAAALHENYPDFDCGTAEANRRAEAAYHRALAATAVAAAVEGSAAEGAAAAATPLPFSQGYQQSIQGRTQASLLRDLFGNPFRPAAVAPACLMWHDGAVVSLARTAYEERGLPSGRLDAARLAVLADMLEGAGATDAELLGHLRGPGPHARGCWALDAVLSKL
jgi:hypothetical protein